MWILWFAYLIYAQVFFGDYSHRDGGWISWGGSLSFSMLNYSKVGYIKVKKINVTFVAICK